MKKRQEIELLRIVSAFGVVWFHTSLIGKDISYSGLIVFLIISMYFSSKANSTHNQLLNRSIRLLLIWIVWFVFYGLINLILKKPFVDLSNGLFSGILAGTSIHLWYIPFILIMVTVFDFIKKYLNGVKLAYICLLLTLLMFGTAEYWRNPSSSLGAPYGQYLHATCAVLIGVFIGNSHDLPKLFLTCSIVLILLTTALVALSFQSLGLPYLIGTAIAALVLLPEWRINPKINVNSLSECTLGIYLSHPFWVLVLYKIGIEDNFYFPFFVFSLSAIFVLLFKRIFPKVSKFLL